MKKTKKLILAEWLESHKRTLSAEGVMKLSNSQDLGVQVKTLDSNGNFVIKFSASDPWIKPAEWLHNYKASAKARYEEAAFVYHSLFPQEDNATLIAGSSDFDAYAYDSLKSCLNIRESELLANPVFPADKERFRVDVANTLQNFPGINRIDTVVALTVGSTALTGLRKEPVVEQFVIDELHNRDKRIG